MTARSASEAMMSSALDLSNDAIREEEEEAMEEDEDDQDVEVVASAGDEVSGFKKKGYISNWQFTPYRMLV